MSAASVRETLERNYRFTDWFGRPHVDEECVALAISAAKLEGVDGGEVRYLDSVLQLSSSSNPPGDWDTVVFEGRSEEMLQTFVDAHS